MFFFMTFASSDIIQAGIRLALQAHTLRLFDDIRLYSDTDLRKDKPFWDKHQEFILSNKRGYGYWIWKPYLIQKHLAQMSDGDVLLYLDAGCELDTRKREMLESYLPIVRRDKLVVTGSHRPEILWTKADLSFIWPLDATEQIQSGIIMLQVCKETRKLIKEWYEYACSYHLINDDPSHHPNHPEFQEHRHDQSILSLLAKRYKLYSRTSLEPAIEILRNKTGESRIIQGS